MVFNLQNKHHLVMKAAFYHVQRGLRVERGMDKKENKNSKNVMVLLSAQCLMILFICIKFV